MAARVWASPCRPPAPSRRTMRIGQALEDWWKSERVACNEDVSSELLGEPDEQPFGAADVAEPICLLVLHHVADELRAVLAQSLERLVDVFYGEHDAEVAERVHRGIPVIGDDG